MHRTLERFRAKRSKSTYFIEMKRIETSQVADLAPKLGVPNPILPGLEREFAEQFTGLKEKITAKCFTNLDGDVVAYRSRLPGILAAAITTRLSRSSEPDVREVLWNDFIVNQKIGTEVLAELIAEDEDIEFKLAEVKAASMLKQVTDGFGDDSVREQASGYIAVKGASVACMMEAFRHPLITGIGQSTRYIDWQEKVDGRYRYVTSESVRNSKYAESYKDTLDHAFDTYALLWDPVWKYITQKNPKPKGVTAEAYKTAIKGRVCDNLRRLLPLASENSFALHGNFRTFTEVELNLMASGSAEERRVGSDMAREQKLVNPPFLAVIDGEHAQPWIKHRITTREILEGITLDLPYGERLKKGELRVLVRTLNQNPTLDIAKAIISYSRPGLSPDQLERYSRDLIGSGNLEKIVQELADARQNRRHKVSDLFGVAVFDVQFREISFAAVKDLMRNRVLLNKSEFDWSGEFGWYVPEDILEMGEEVNEKYNEVQARSIEIAHQMAGDFPSEARLAYTHGTNTNWRICLGGAEGVWIPELRSIASGDSEYRGLAIDMWRGETQQVPLMGTIAKFVDTNVYTVGRIKEAVREDLKRGATRV